MTSSALLTYDLELQCKVNSILTRKKTTHQSQKIYYAIIYQVSVFVNKGNSYNWNVVIFGSNHELPLLMIIFMRIEIVTKFFSQNLILQINVGPVSRNLRLSYIFKEIQIILRLFLVIAMPSITDGVHRNVNFVEIIPVFSSFSKFFKVFQKKLLKPFYVTFQCGC